MLPPILLRLTICAGFGLGLLVSSLPARPKTVQDYESFVRHVIATHNGKKPEVRSANARSQRPPAAAESTKRPGSSARSAETGPEEESNVAYLSQNYSYLTNLSLHCYQWQGRVAGIYFEGGSAADALVRVVGPSLANYGVSPVFPDPFLEVLRYNSPPPAGPLYLANEDWWSGGDAQGISDLGQQVGAFPLNPFSSDAAVRTSLWSSYSTAIVNERASGEGRVMLEVYVENPNLAVPMNNFYLSGEIAQGQPMIMGFVFQGSDRTFLMRARNYLMPGAVWDPAIALYNSSGQLIASNDNWREQPGAIAVSQAAETLQVAALAIDSPEAALLVTLPPGAYTLHITSVLGDHGSVFPELFSLP